MSHRNDDKMSTQDRAAQADLMDEGALLARQLAQQARQTAAANGDAVERACFTRIANTYDELATYYVGRAAGFRQ